MYITHKAIDRPRVVLVITLLIVLTSVLAGLGISVQRSPAINTAVVLVAVPYPGAKPTEVEEQITRKIEDTLQRLDKVDFISSTSMRNSSVTQVIFLDGVDSKRARSDVEHLVNEIRNELPVGREIQPVITEIDFESAPIMLVTLAGPAGFDERTLKQIAEDVQDDLEGIPGVANTQLFGGREREVHVDANPHLLNQYGLTLGGLQDAIVRAHAEMPAGQLNSSTFDPQIVNETRIRGVEDIRSVVIGHSEGRTIRVEDVAEVEDTYRRLQNFAQLDGRDSATIIINKEANINSLATAQAIKERVGELQEQYPHIVMSCTRDVASEIGVMFSVLGSSAVFGAMLVLIILTWSMGLRISILVLMAIPFSTSVALIFLYLADIAISSMVVFSYILILGMVVDGAIIVAENIHRHIERGEHPVVAAKVGIDEVGIPVIAADLTTVAAFGPMLLVPGIMGDFMGMMPKVVSVALLGSVLVDHFLIPVVASLWYRQRETPNEPVGGPSGATESGTQSSHLRPGRGIVSKTYEKILAYSLGHRWVVVCMASLAIVWAGAMLHYKFIASIFFPQGDYGQFDVNFELPLGYSIEETAAAARVITDPIEELRRKGDVVHYVSAIGSSAGLTSRLEGDPATGPEFGRIMVELEPPMNRDRTQVEIIRELQSKIKPYPGMIYRIEEREEGPPGGFDVAIRLTGKNLEQIGVLGRRLAALLEQTPGTFEAGTDYRPESPEVVIEPVPEVVGLFDMTESDVAQAIQMAVLGDNRIELSMDDEDVALRIQVAPEFQLHQDNIKRLVLTGSSGRKATIGELCDISRREGLYAVNRYEHRRSVTARCDVKQEEKVFADDIFDIVRAEYLPELGFAPVVGDRMTFLGKPGTAAEGVRASFTGENEERDKNMTYMSQSMIVAVVMILAILVIQFNSFRQTFVVLIAVPLSFVGVILGMWLCDFAFSLSSFIGLVALTGIVVNDAIVMVDFTNQARRRGLSVYDSLMEAGINRLRPVILTTVTTIGGMLPLFLNISGGAEFWQPLCGAVIFGLAGATMLTLIVIPVCYSLAYDFHPLAGIARVGSRAVARVRTMGRPVPRDRD